MATNENNEKIVVLTECAQGKDTTLVPVRNPRRHLRTRKEIAKSTSMLESQSKETEASEWNNVKNENFEEERRRCNSTSKALETLLRLSPLNSVVTEMDNDNYTMNLRSTARQIRSSSTDSESTGSTSADDISSEDLHLNGIVDFKSYEKEWMMACCRGDCILMDRLMTKYPKLVQKKDFMTGFTALHWAAKLGRADMIEMVVNCGADLHAKTRGGQTALHLAAVSGSDALITILINVYNADIHVRDFAGRKAKDLIKNTVAQDIQRKLGRSLILEPGGKSPPMRILSLQLGPDRADVKRKKLPKLLTRTGTDW